MSYTLVNTAAPATAGPIAGITVPATTIGNLAVLSVCYDASVTLTTITGGGTWARVGTSQLDSGNGQKVETWWALLTASVTSLTFNTALQAVTVPYCEFSSSAGWSGTPLRTQDTTKAFTTATTATDNAASNSITPTAGDLVVAAYADTSDNQASIAHGTGFTTGVADLGAAGTGAGALEWEQAAGGSQNATYTVGSGGHSYTVQVAAFAPAGGGPPPAAGSFFGMLQ